MRSGVVGALTGVSDAVSPAATVQPSPSFPPLARRKGPLDAILGEADRALRVLAGASSSEPALSGGRARHPKR